jgi:hypothetical protein
VLGGGLALFLASDVAFRLILKIRPVAQRAVGTLVLLLVIPAAAFAGALGLATAIAVLVLMIYFEDRARGVRWGNAAAWTAPSEQ